MASARSCPGSSPMEAVASSINRAPTRLASASKSSIGIFSPQLVST